MDDEELDRWLKQQHDDLIERIAASMDLEFGFQHVLMWAQALDILEDESP